MATSATRRHDALNASLDDLQAVGCDTVALAFLPPDGFADLDAVKQSADTINAAADDRRRSRCRARLSQPLVGVRDDDRWPARPGRSLFERLDADVFAELDLYWATVGGADPTAVIAELGDRLRLLHVKDGPADDPKHAMVAVGSGTIDVAGVLSAAPTAQWHIVELDRCDTDMFDAVEDSYRYLVGAGLSRGRT